MKIAKIILVGTDGRQVVFEEAPFYLQCGVGRCLIHGGEDIYALCPQCNGVVCSDHWNEAISLCDDCVAVGKISRPGL